MAASGEKRDNQLIKKAAGDYQHYKNCIAPRVPMVMGGCLDSWMHKYHVSLRTHILDAHVIPSNRAGAVPRAELCAQMARVITTVGFDHWHDDNYSDMDSADEHYSDENYSGELWLTPSVEGLSLIHI